ncbi:hypothetical protein HYW17_01310 [Candidatus Uhrbacteria bacterium]|nr:hypothetical protein [Candidatus Uhrbacteria bacterium]
MNTQSTHAAVNIPLTALKCLYRNESSNKVVCEIDVDSLREVNEPATIDEMVAEAHLEYFSGRTKGFDNTKNLMGQLAIH